MTERAILAAADLWEMSRWAGGEGVPLTAGVQAGFDDLGTALRDTTFVVVDLETTGGRSGDDAITEIGAVKVLGGEVIGEFQTLVDPGIAISGFISRLTGIDSSMVSGCPRIEAVLPSFLEFARGSVLVAHNAPFDVGFLKAAARKYDYEWPRFPVLDTVTLARIAVPRGEVVNHKLSTLAEYFHATTTPDHRALSDARATVDVLHGIFDRLAAFGATHLEDLQDLGRAVPASRARKRTLADNLPSLPGVYMFKDRKGKVLYVGTSRDIRKRVKQYFTASERRARMNDMVAAAESVTPVICETPLEASVRELRLIAEHQPPYNRASRRPERPHWVRLTEEAFPRLSVVASPPEGGRFPVLGPFLSRSAAAEAVEALLVAVPLRQCSTRLPKAPKPGASSCLLLDLGRCGGPCIGKQNDDAYLQLTSAMGEALGGSADRVVSAMGASIAEHVSHERFEQAAEDRDHLTAYLKAARTRDELLPFANASQIVAASPMPAGGWEFVLIREGRFAGTALAPRGTPTRPVIDSLIAAGDRPEPSRGALPAGTLAEARLLLAWVNQPLVRLVELDGQWSSPRLGAGRFGGWLEKAQETTSTLRYQSGIIAS